MAPVPRLRVLFRIFSVGCLIAAVLIATRSPEPPELNVLSEPSNITTICDPFAEPGFLYWDQQEGSDARWIPFAEECEPAPDWVSLIAQRDTERMSFLVNKTILILGDSVDRNGLHQMAEMLGLPRYPVPYRDWSERGNIPWGWDARGIPWVVEIPWFNTIFTNGFFYGLDDEDNLRFQPDWHPPGLAEDRIDELFKVHTDQLPRPPSFISLHSGLWDLAFFGRQDRSNGLSAEMPLAPERVEWWQRRYRHLVKHIKRTWPNTPLWLRKLHRVGPLGSASSTDWRHDGHEESVARPVTFTNFFTDVRVQQIRDMQEQVAIDTGTPSFDFGEIWEGWQAHQDMVHPNKWPGGPIYVHGLIHHIYMESLGREKWSLAQQRPLSSLEWRDEYDELDTDVPPLRGRSHWNNTREELL